MSALMENPYFWLVAVGVLIFLLERIFTRRDPLVMEYVHLNIRRAETLVWLERHRDYFWQTHWDLPETGEIPSDLLEAADSNPRLRKSLYDGRHARSDLDELQAEIEAIKVRKGWEHNRAGLKGELEALTLYRRAAWMSAWSVTSAARARRIIDWIEKQAESIDYELSYTKH